jgi:hypothetical protein
MSGLGIERSVFIKSLLLLAMVACTITVAGCDDPNWESPPHYQYKINITGLENFNSISGQAHIMMPVPEADGKVSLPFEDPLAGQQYIYPGRGPWNSNFAQGGICLKQTPRGLMLDIGLNESAADKNSTDALLKNVSFSMVNIFGPSGSRQANDTANELISHPLVPVLNDTPTPYTVWIKGENVSNYTTYLYIDENLEPINASNRSIDVYVEFGIIVGYHPYGESSTQTIYVIKESIPANVTGFIPVRVQYAGSRRGFYFIED